MDIYKKRVSDLLEYLSNLEDTKECFSESKNKLLKSINELTIKYEQHKILEVEIEDLVDTVENDAFICGICTGVKLKNILDKL